MSVGLFTLQNADVKAVGQELDKAIGDKATSPLTGILRIIPIERLNALLVITPQPAYLDEAKKWIARLDQPAAAATAASFFVYNLQNQRAEKLGPLLTQAFTGRAQAQAARLAPTLAPGTPPGTIVSPPTFAVDAARLQPFSPDDQRRTRRRNGRDAAGGAAGTVRGAAARGGDGLGIIRNIQVVADKDNNTLLDRRDAARVRGDRSGAEEARRAVAAGRDRGHDRVGHADRRPRVRRRVAVQGRRAVGPRLGRQRHRLDARSIRRSRCAAAADRRGQSGARDRAGLLLHHQQLEFPRRRAGGAAPARPVRRHQGDRESASRGARQPEGDDQGRHADPDQPAEHRRQRDERRHDDVVSTSTPAC